jgi:protein-disulfide isomerase
VRATPTFFINGKKFEGALSLADLDREIEPLL